VKKFGILLVNLGTPDKPTTKSVKKYLAEFLWDRRVVDVPRPLWWLILNGIILNVRPGKVAKDYKNIWTEQGAPLRVISNSQQEKLSLLLEQRFGHSVPVAIGMNYGNPSLTEGIDELLSQGCDSILTVPLYPQYSSATTASVFDRVQSVFDSRRFIPEIRHVHHYYDEPSYIRALAQSVTNYWQEHGKPDHLVLSYHGVPQRFCDQGDPYDEHCKETTAKLAIELGLKQGSWTHCYQSRFGKEPWLQPYTDETLEQYAADDMGIIDVLCPAFSVDCLETLYEIQVENRELYMEAGGKNLRYIPALNDSDDHIQCIATIVEQHIQDWL